MRENFMHYRGYTAQVEYSAEDGLFVGEVLGLKHSIIGFHGESVKELTEDFHNAMDFYLECCAEDGRKPERPDELDVRLELPYDVHNRITMQAEATGKSMNQVIVDMLRKSPSAKKSRTGAAKSKSSTPIQKRKHREIAGVK